VSPKLHGELLPEDVLNTVVPAAGNRDLFELIVIDEVFRQSKPLLAICRGQQILNVALGGNLLGDIPLQCPAAAGHNRQPERFEPVHEVELEADSQLASLFGSTRIRVNSTHHQAIGRVAPPLRAVGRSPDGIIEALELAPDHRQALPFCISVQFHPERLYDRYPGHARLFAAFVAHCAPPQRPGDPGH
jgi:putative glutamine amidotransferase